MSDINAPILIYTTFASAGEAEALGKQLLKRNLAACVNIFPAIISLYQWRGQPQRGAEAAMIVKTRAGRGDDAVRVIEELHPYELPAILTLPVTGGGTAFIDWIAARTTPRRKPV
ncbi:MAG: divalent-cation tolerance protein CutA [Hyphomicrobiales bacterium]